MACPTPGQFAVAIASARRVRGLYVKRCDLATWS